MLLLLLALLIAVWISCSVGTAGGSFRELFLAVFHGQDDFGMGRIMVEMRMPRALTAALTGASFAAAGAIMQGITRNPLADSGLLGINAGAGFAVAVISVCISMPSQICMAICAFCGALLAAVIVFLLGVGKGHTDSLKLILSGAAVSALLTALSQGISITFSLSKDLSYWTAGSLSGCSWPQLKSMAVWLLTALLLSFLISGKLTILSLGEDRAVSLGLDVRKVYLLSLGITLLLAGGSVSMVGGVSFLGLIIPHITRIIVGADYRRILPASALGGAVLMVISDIAARMIHAPYDTPVGALISLIGVPVFLLFTYRKGGGFL